MKVIYYFPEYDTPMFQWQRIHIIDELSRHGIEIETFNPLIYVSPDEANEQFINTLKTNKYDLFISSVCYEGIIYKKVLETANQQGIPSLLIRWDNLTIPFFDKNQAKYFDLVWLTASDTSYLYDQWGCNYLVLPYAANPYTIKYKQFELVRKLCFLGTPHGSRPIMINTITKAGLDLDLYYGGKQETNATSKIKVKYDIVCPSYWQIMKERLLFKEGRKIILGGIYSKIRGTQEVDENVNLHRYNALEFSEIPIVYSKHVLSLSSTSSNHTDTLSNPLKIVNLRSFEIPMSGGIAICKYNEELAGYFEDGKEIVFYNDNEELIDKAKHYITKASDAEIFRMKTAARLRAENDHAWWNRFVVVFKTLGIFPQ